MGVVDFLIKNKTGQPGFVSQFTEEEFKRDVWEVCSPITIKFIVMLSEGTPLESVQMLMEKEQRITISLTSGPVLPEQGIPLELPPNRDPLELEVMLSSDGMSILQSRQTWHIPANGRPHSLGFSIIPKQTGRVPLYFEVSAPNGWRDSRKKYVTVIQESENKSDG